MRMWVMKALLAVTLAGCSGGGGGDAPPPDDRITIDDIIDSAPVSDPRLLPVAGRASYLGYMRTRLPTGPEGARVDYLGDLTLDVNFAAARDQIAGSATGFDNGASDRLDGILTITGGDIYNDTDPSAAYTFDGDVDGVLTGGSGAHTIDARIEGEFRGVDKIAVNGLVFGDVTGPDGIDVFDGTFAAERRRD